MRISDWSSDVCSSDLANHGDGIDLQPCRAARPGGKAGLHRQPDRRKDTELLADEQARRDTDGHGGEYLVHRQAAQRDTGIGETEQRHDAERDRSNERMLQPVQRGKRRMRLPRRSEEHTYELQSLMRISYDVVCLR